MIKKLQRKFVLINMILVMIILLTAFFVIGYSSYVKQKMALHEALEHALSEKYFFNPDTDVSESVEAEFEKIEIGRPKDGLQNFNFLLSFCVTVDSKGNVLHLNNTRVDISTDVLDEAIDIVLLSKKESGSISRLNLSYMQATTVEGTRIAFVDTTNSDKVIANLLLTMLLVGFFGFFAFLIISIYLARWTIRPVKIAWEQQRQFVADASHELKTPITVILANADILLRHEKDTIESQKKWVTYMKDEANRMKKLVEDMLFLAKSDSSKLPAIKELLNLSDLIWSCSLPFESIAYEQGLTLSTSIQPDLFMTGNAGQLKELVGIFLDNACKYADTKGTITLTLEKHQDKIHLVIHNTGGYIEEEQCKHLFERFYRVDESRVRKAGGYGLGLAIAKSITDQHNGKIHVKSHPEKGTTFEVLFSYR